MRHPIWHTFGGMLAALRAAEGAGDWQTPTSAPTRRHYAMSRAKAAEVMHATPAKSRATTTTSTLMTQLSEAETSQRVTT